MNNTLNFNETRKLYKKIQGKLSSMQKIKNMYNIDSGMNRLNQTIDVNNLNILSDREDSSSDSDEEAKKKKDVFESSAYW